MNGKLSDTEILDMIEDFLVNECDEDADFNLIEALDAIDHISSLIDRYRHGIEIE